MEFARRTTHKISVFVSKQMLISLRQAMRITITYSKIKSSRKDEKWTNVKIAISRRAILLQGNLFMNNRKFNSRSTISTSTMLLNLQMITRHSDILVEDVCPENMMTSLWFRSNAQTGPVNKFTNKRRRKCSSMQLAQWPYNWKYLVLSSVPVLRGKKR